MRPTHLGVALLVEHDVLGLDVAVADVLVVQVPHRVHNLPEEPPRLALGQACAGRTGHVKDMGGLAQGGSELRRERRRSAEGGAAAAPFLRRTYSPRLPPGAYSIKTSRASTWQ